MSDVGHERLPPNLAEALRNYMARANADRPVSIATMVRRTRYVMPDLSISDRELAQLIAEEIVRSGGNVDFDGEGEKRSAAG